MKGVSPIGCPSIEATPWLEFAQQPFRSFLKAPLHCAKNWQLAGKLVAWFTRLVLPSSYQRVTIQTLRHRLLDLAGKLVHTARRHFLVSSAHYRDQAVWRFAIERLIHLQFG